MRTFHDFIKTLHIIRFSVNLKAFTIWAKVYCSMWKYHLVNSRLTHKMLCGCHLHFVSSTISIIHCVICHCIIRYFTLRLGQKLYLMGPVVTVHSINPSEMSVNFQMSMHIRATWVVVQCHRWTHEKVFSGVKQITPLYIEHMKIFTHPFPHTPSHSHICLWDTYNLNCFSLTCQVLAIFNHCVLRSTYCSTSSCPWYTCISPWFLSVFLYVAVNGFYIIIH